MEIPNMRKVLRLSVIIAAIVAATALTGCGGGGSGGSGSGTSTAPNTNNGDPAPAAIGGKTFNGHILALGGMDVSSSNITWQIVFTTSGTYSYTEHHGGSDSGSYNYMKTGPTSGTVNLSDGTTLALTYASTTRGNYQIASSGESGSFT